MKSNLLIAIIVLLSFNNSQAQLPDGSIAPDFTVTDLNGTTHKLYEDYTDQGYTVFIDFSAVWCPPCWGYHSGGTLENLYEMHGPAGYPGVSQTTTNDVMVIFIEGDGNAKACLEGTGCGTQGDWVTGTKFPIICTDGVNPPANQNPTGAYQISGWPTVYQVCPDRTLTKISTGNTNPYSLVTSCLPPPSLQNDARSFMSNSASTGCSSVTPEITLQNYGLSNLTSVIIDVSLNGNFQYTTTWTGNLTTLNIQNFLLDPITGLVNNDLITIDVTMPNGVNDADPSNNQTISYIVDLGFDNAYWDGDLSITVSGDASNSWYLKQVSNNFTIVSGYGGVTGEANWFPLEFSECYALQSITAIGQTYTVTDAIGNIVLNGTVSMVEEFDHFTTGNEIWTGIKEVSEKFNIYPNPANDILTIDGDYTSATIYDVFGKVVLTTDYRNTINVAGLSNGIYFINMNTKNAITVKKITIAK